jgi:hypothetical protein
MRRPRRINAKSLVIQRDGEHQGPAQDPAYTNRCRWLTSRSLGGYTVSRMIRGGRHLVRPPQSISELAVTPSGEDPAYRRRQQKRRKMRCSGRDGKEAIFN